MNTIKSILLFGLQGLAFCGWTQSITDEIQFVQNLWGMEKKTIVKDYMQLSDVESAAFWNVYDAYSEEKKELLATRIGIIKEYSQNYLNLTNDKADGLSKRIFKNDIKLSKLQQKYYNKLKKATSPLTASQFMQLENYMQTLIRSQVQEDIPFIGELSKKKGS